MIWSTDKGVDVLVDDDVVCNMREGVEIDLQVAWNVFPGGSGGGVGGLPAGRGRGNEGRDECDLRLSFRDG